MWIRVEQTVRLRASAARVGLVHIGVFILLLLSGERNFGVRLNKPYTLRVPMDIPVFTGTYADLLIVVRGWTKALDYNFNQPDRGRRLR